MGTFCFLYDYLRNPASSCTIFPRMPVLDTWDMLLLARTVTLNHDLKAPMSELTTRIRRITEDLRAVQQQLSSAARPDAPSTERDAVMQEMINVELINEFKTSVDHMRHLLWSYIEASSSKGRLNVSDTLQNVRMQRVTEMLRILQPTVDGTSNTSSPEAKSFFDVINTIANSAVDSNQTKRQDSDRS